MVWVDWGKMTGAGTFMHICIYIICMRVDGAWIDG